MKTTLRLRGERSADIAHAAALLRGGGLVAFPTETVYGLGALALSQRAVEGIFAAKARPAWDPLIVHVASIEQVGSIADIAEVFSDRVRVLATAFWPGPLTLLLPRTAAVPDAVTAGRPLVGVRVPRHPVAHALLQAAGVPIAAPSANRFGHVSPTTAEHVLADLDGRIDAVLDAGPCAVGVESTVLDPAGTPMILYRAGAVTAEMLEAACGLNVVAYHPPEALGAPAALPSPGVGMRHYAPEAQVLLTAGQPEALWAAAEKSLATGKRTAVLLPGDWPVRSFTGLVVHRWGRWDQPSSLAAGLFAGLRALEQGNAEVIVCPMPEPGDVRDAIRDRLLKAARDL